ncbi:MAG: hypothetical protein E5V89_13635 [Mesorhizobium sp.]|nr:MAG: hypothetical protein E5V89_13635 [Mesorhizobium sp.]
MSGKHQAAAVRGGEMAPEKASRVDVIAKHCFDRDVIAREFLAKMALAPKRRNPIADRRPPGDRQERRHAEIEQGKQAFAQILVGDATQLAGADELAAEETDGLAAVRHRHVGDDLGMVDTGG